MPPKIRVAIDQVGNERFLRVDVWPLAKRYDIWPLAKRYDIKGDLETALPPLLQQASEDMTAFLIEREQINART